MSGSSMINLPPEVAQKILTTLVDDNERLTAENTAITKFREVENEWLARAMRTLEEVRELHHWVRKLDGSETCETCVGPWPCATMKALSMGEDVAPHVDL